jgi:DNA-directed RNA polymerase specialized sigma24 family protein
MSGDHSDFRTRWSVLERMHGTEAEANWAWFVQRYRDYVAAVLHRAGLRPAEVDSAADEFWSYLFRSRAIERADRSGRFRSFLSGVVRNYVHVWRREQSAAPGAIDVEALARMPSLREDEDITLWAQQMLHLGLQRLSHQHSGDAQALRWFYGVPDHVDAPPAPRVRATDIAQRLGCSANAMHQTLFRARNRLRECIEVEVAATVGTMRDVGSELDLLTLAVGRTSPGILDAREERES